MTGRENRGRGEEKKPEGGGGGNCSSLAPVFDHL